MKVAFLIIVGILVCECAKTDTGKTNTGKTDTGKTNTGKTVAGKTDTAKDAKKANVLQKAKDLATKKFKGKVVITDKHVNDFDNYKTKFKKNYKNEEKEGKSLAVIAFKDNLIKKHNKEKASGKSKFKIGFWEYSDMSAEEIAEEMTGLVLRPHAKSVYENHFPEDVPDHVNYVEQGLVTDIMNQGICGCCWAFSALGAIEGQMAKKTGKLVKLSEQNLIDCNKDEAEGNWGCNGGDMETVYDYIKRKSHGINTASDYGYKGKGEFSCQYDPDQSVVSVKDYGRVQSGNETLLMQALSHVGPLAIAVDASSDMFQNYKGGVLDDPACGQKINHAVILVGYGTDPEYGEYWLVKNSWGESYGEGGYIRIARNHDNMCGIANEITYPIVETLTQREIGEK